MKEFLDCLQAYATKDKPNFGDGESVLTMLYECHNENKPFDNEQIKEDFNELYRQMNGMSLQEMDKRLFIQSVNCVGITKGQDLLRASRLESFWRMN